MRSQLRSTAGILSLSLGLALTVGPRTSGAQGTASDLDQLVIAAALELAPADGANGMAQEGRKSPVLAGVLSWIFPGFGSYYAGNTGHGARHLVIQVVALGVTIWGAVESSEVVHPAAWVGGGALVVNSIWSIVVAVIDASAYNRTLSMGSFYFEPNVVALRTPNVAGFDNVQPQASRVGVQFVRFAF